MAATWALDRAAGGNVTFLKRAPTPTVVAPTDEPAPAMRPTGHSGPRPHFTPAPRPSRSKTAGRAADAPPDGTHIAAGTVIEGTLRTAGAVQVAGIVQGTLEAQGAVQVATSGRVVARVVAPELIVGGLVDGRIQCAGRLVVQASGLVRGTIQAGTMRIEEGAVLEGQCQMGAGPAALPAVAAAS